MSARATARRLRSCSRLPDARGCAGARDWRGYCSRALTTRCRHSEPRVGARDAGTRGAGAMRMLFHPFSHSRPTDVVDILVVTTLVYIAIVWIRRTEAVLVARGIFILALLYAVARTLGLQLTAWIFQGFFAIFLRHRRHHLPGRGAPAPRGDLRRRGRGLLPARRAQARRDGRRWGGEVWAPNGIGLREEPHLSTDGRGRGDAADRGDDRRASGA